MHGDVMGRSESLGELLAKPDVAARRFFGFWSFWWAATATVGRAPRVRGRAGSAVRVVVVRVRDVGVVADVAGKVMPVQRHGHLRSVRQAVRAVISGVQFQFGLGLSLSSATLRFSGRGCFFHAK